MLFPEQQVIYGAARDITERKAAEETLASYARELESSRRELEDQAARQAQLVRELEIAKRPRRRRRPRPRAHFSRT